MSSSKWKWLIAGILLILVVVLSAALRSHPSSGDGKDRNQQLLSEVRNQATPVAVEQIQYGSITREIHLTGTVQSPNTADVSAPVAGVMQAVYVTEGSRVTAGQTLAQLNTSQAQTQVAQSLQQLKAAQIAYDKALAARTLMQHQTAYDVEMGRTSLSLAEAGLAKAQGGAGPAFVAEAVANARQAHIAADQAASALKRTRFLYEHGVTPESTYEDVKSKAEQAQAAAQAADAVVSQARDGASPADLQLARDKVTEARQSLDQTTNSRQARNAMADADVQNALSQIKSAQEQLQVSQVQLSYTRIISPVNGVVTSVRIHPGESAIPGQPVISLTSMDSVFFETLVSEGEKLQLALGQSATITVQAAPGHTFAGSVVNIVPAINPGSAGYEVRLSIISPKVTLPPGAYARATVATGTADHVLIAPATSVISSPNGQNYVYTLSASNTAVKTTVVTGLSSGSRVEIVSGLKEGDQVVTTGAELLQPGDSVSIQTGG